MKAVGYRKSLPIEDKDALIDFEAAKPEPKGRDIRVAVQAISANPVDYKVRKRAAPPEGETNILGFDAAGVVDAVGPDVSLFKPGDEVFYAGSILRQGTNSQFHLVDERIVGNKPKSLSFAQAAAVPLTSITAWELLFDRLGAVPGKSVDPRTLLIVGGAGGVGSIMIQLARRLTGLTVSRPRRGRSRSMVPRSRRARGHRSCKADEGADRGGSCPGRRSSRASPSPTSTTRPLPTSWRRRASSA